MKKRIFEVSKKLYEQVSTIPYVPIGRTLAQKYYQIGFYFKDSIHDSIKRRYKYMKRKGLIKKEKLIAKVIYEHLYEKSNEKTKYSYLAKEYLDCLTSWAKGANIAKISEKYKIDSLMFAIILQNDDAGCQSVLLRVNGGVTLLHTEEDDSTLITNRVSKSFIIKINESYIFAYNDILPAGSAFSVDVKNNFAFSCDTLRLKKVENGKCLAKIVGWMIWKLGNQSNPTIIQEIIKEFDPFVDGYAINIINKVKNKIISYKVSFGSNGFEIDYLGKKVGVSLCQTNLLDARDVKNFALANCSMSQYEINRDIEPNHRIGGYYKGYLDRIVYLNLLIKNNIDKIYLDWNEISASTLHSKILSYFGIGYNSKGFDGKGKWDLSNISVGGTISVFIGDKKSNAGINLGPSLGSKRPDILI